MVFVNAFEGTDVREKVAHIADFSGALGSLLGMMCDGFGELQSDSVQQSKLVQEFMLKVEKHTNDIERLDEYNVTQETNKDSHNALMNELQQFILEFNSTSEMLRTELSNLRLTTKNEIFATQGAMEKLFMDAIANMPAAGGGGSGSGGNKTIMLNADGKDQMDGETRVIASEYSQDDALQMLADRLFALEKKFALSEVSNTQLRNQLDQQLQAQDKFDLLTTQINQQDAQLQAQHDRARIFEANLLKLKSGQIKTEKSLKDMNKKVDYLGSTIQKLIAGGIGTGHHTAAAGVEGGGLSMSSFEFAFPDESSLGDDVSLTLETESVMQEIAANPTYSRTYLGAGGDPAAHDMIAALEQKLDDVLAPKLLRLQDDNSDLSLKLVEMNSTIEHLTEMIRGFEQREEEAKARRKEGRNNFANDDEFYESLASLKTHWGNIFGDIEQKLNDHAKELANNKEFTEDDLKAIKDMAEFRNLLAESLHAFEPEDTVEKTMDKLYPRLDSINVEANRLFKTDKQISGMPNDEDEEGVLDQIEMSSGRGVSFLHSQSHSFHFDESKDEVGSAKSPSVAGDNMRSLSRVASLPIPEGDDEDDSAEGEVEPTPPSQMVPLPVTRALSRSSSKRLSRVSRSNSNLTASTPATNGSGQHALIRQPSALETFTNELANACLSSAPILGERIDKGVLKRRIDRVEDALGNFALLVDLNEEVDHFARELDCKADRKDVKELRKKKANLSDLQTLRDQMFEQMESLRIAIGSNTMRSGSDGLGIGGAAGEANGATFSGDIAKRFDKLYNQFQDLVAHCAGFVHRDEVEAALQSIVAELKSVKNASIELEAVKKLVGKKADNWEVQRLISILSGGLTEPALGPAAIHAKCLSCDKPLVNPILQSLQSFGYATHVNNGTRDNDDDAGRQLFGGSRPNTTGGGARPNSTGHNDMMSRSLSDAKALRAAIASGPAAALNEGLPPISKNRVRMSAGGGAGPSYTYDTK